MLWNILVFLALGALIGWLVGKIMNVKGSWLFTILLGVAGSFLGSFVTGLIPGLKAPFMSFTIAGVAGGIIGGCLLVWLFRLIRKK